ncbi:MFS transporter [Streptomyces sp. NBC_01477]|uniref:MFS transporter n=1 Tax=Streptomyces sp. NBC_01477 TaxID=2976015 RepID=UPI002E33C96A|nr:MFS transporter [Streptomyces sp. NBC_01477]
MDTDTGAGAPHRPGRLSVPTATLIAVSVTTFMLPLDYTIVSVALHDIQESLHTGYAGLQWVVNGYTLTFAALLMAGGTLGDRYGRKRLFMSGTGVFTLASLLAGLAGSALVLNLARGVQGVGAALMFAAAVPLLTQEFQGRARARAFAVFGVAVGTGAGLGPLLGGLIVSGLGWRWAFLLNVPVGAAMLLLTRARVRESRDPRAGRVDWTGMAVFTAGSGALVYALIAAPDSGWSSLPVLLALAVTAVSCVAFAVVERRHSYPMFDLELFRRPAFVGASIAALVLSVSYWGIFLYTPLYLQISHGYSPLEAGLAALPFALPGLFVPRLGEYLAHRMRGGALLALGQALVAAGTLWLFLSVSAGSGWPAIVGGALVSGAGTGLINGEMTNVAMSAAPDNRAGMASGINATMRQIGVALGFAGLGSVLAARVIARLGDLSSGEPGVAGHLHDLGKQVVAGNIGSAADRLPPASREAFVHASRNSFYSGLHLILAVAAAVALAGAVATYVLTRHDGRGGGTTVVAGGSADSTEAVPTAGVPL